MHIADKKFKYFIFTVNVFKKYLMVADILDDEVPYEAAFDIPY